MVACLVTILYHDWTLNIRISFDQLVSGLVIILNFQNLVKVLHALIYLREPAEKAKTLSPQR